MTLDERASRAAEGVRGAVRTTAAPADTFGPPQPPARKSRYAIAAVAGVTAAIVVVAFAVGHALSNQRQPRPGSSPSPRGVILYGQWHPALQQSSWFTVRPDGTETTNLRVTSTCASWWPSGDKILISLDVDAGPGRPLRPATIKPDGTGLHRLAGARAPSLNLGCGQVAPDGNSIVLEGFGNAARSSANGLYLIRSVDGGGLKRLTRSPVGESDADPRFAPDGRHIVFLRDSHHSGVEGAGALYVTSAGGAAPRRITPDGFAFLGYDWSPDGHWIVLQHPYGQLYVVHPDGTGLRRIPVRLPPGTGAQNPVWAADSATIAFSLVRNDRADIYTVRLDGTHLRQVTHDPGAMDQTPDWSR